MSARNNDSSPGPLEVLDDGVNLLRVLPARAWVAWAAGTLPFAAGLLLALNRLGWGTADHSDAIVTATWLTALYFWMKCMHARFSRELWSAVTGTAPAPGRPLEILRSRLTHYGLAVLLFVPALFLVLPMGWFLAWYQSLGPLENAGSGPLAHRAWKQAMLWPLQNHLTLLLAGFLAFFININWIALLLMIPAFLSFLTGHSSDFQRQLELIGEGPLAAFTLVLTWVTFDPLFKAVYTMRCFMGLARGNGEDLRLAWRRASRLALLLALLPLLPQDLRAEDAAPPPALIDEAVFREALDDTLSEPRFSWRLPRAEAAATDSVSLLEVSAEVLRNIRDWIWDLIPERKEDEKDSKPEAPQQETGAGSGVADGLTDTVVKGLLGLALVGVLVMLLRAYLQNRKDRHAQAPPAGVESTPNVEDEQLTGSELPQNQWVAMGDAFLSQGDFRKATRAYFLAHLALLADAGSIHLGRSKSNGDYQLELRMRRHIFPREFDNYGLARRRFERIWYGGELAAEDDARALRSLLPDGRVAA